MYRYSTVVCLLCSLVPFSSAYGRTRLVAGEGTLAAAPGDTEAEEQLQAVSAPVEESSGPQNGRYKLRLGIGKPTFPKVKYYKTLYNDPGYWPMLGVDFKLLDLTYVTLGGGMRVAYYKDMGSPATKVVVDNPSDAEIVSDKGSTSLSLVPLTFLVNGQISLTPSKLLSMDFWAGFEEIYFEETRLSSTETTSATAGTENSEGVPVNSGRHDSLVFGGSLNVDMAWLESGKESSSLSSIGLRVPQISPFFEFSTKLNSKRVLIAGTKTSKVDFSRIMIGISVVFETLH